MCCGLSCGCAGFGRTFADILTSYERLSMWIAFVAVVTCIASTLILMVSVGIGLGYNYCYVVYNTNGLDTAADGSGGGDSGKGGGGGDAEGMNLFHYKLQRAFENVPNLYKNQNGTEPQHHLMKRSVTQQIANLNEQNIDKESSTYANPWLRKGSSVQRHSQRFNNSNHDELNPFILLSEEEQKLPAMVQGWLFKLANLKQNIVSRMNSLGKTDDRIVRDSKNFTFVI